MKAQVIKFPKRKVCGFRKALEAILYLLPFEGKRLKDAVYAMHRQGIITVKERDLLLDFYKEEL